MTSRLTPSRFIGRVGELAELELAAREATSGRPTLVLLGGDSGVGKTRLVAELSARLANAAGAGGAADGDGHAANGRDGGEHATPLILRGDAVDQGDAELPYAPLLGALRPLVRDCHPVFESLSTASRAQLATLLPGLADDVAPSAPGADRPDSGGQLRLFEALLELIDALSDRQPVVLIIEDMHWADRSTRAFVMFLTRSLRTERVMLLLTYRTDELHRRHPLLPMLSELDRVGRARRIGLEPFDRDELREALADILGSEPDGPLLERLFTRGEGNPLYTEELLAAGLDGRGAAPQGLRHAFMVRLERLSDDAQRIARAVAVGRRLDEGAIAALTGLDRPAVQAALREAVAEQVLVPCSDQLLCFRHALLREAMYDDLLPGERGELHAALARHLEDGQLDGDGDELERSASIASHFDAAGDQPAALRTTVHAADAARHAQAYGEAAHLLSRALDLWARVHDPERVAGIDHVELLARAAVALSIVDERARAEALLRQALEELDPDTDPGRYASLLGRLARIQWSLRDNDEGVATAERALAIVPPEDPNCDATLIRAWLARVQSLRGKFREAVVDGEAALEAAIARHDGEAETELLDTLGMAHVGLGETEKGIDLLWRAIALARERGDIASLSTAYGNLADMFGLIGRPEEGMRTAREGLELTPRNYVRSHDWLTLTLSEMALDAGDWALARECLSIPASRSSGSLYILRQLREADLAAAVGEEERALESLQSIACEIEESTQPQWIGMFGSLAAEVHARRGELDEAQKVVARALDRMEVCTDDVARIALVSAAGLQVEADRAQRARDLGDTGMRRDALARARLHQARIAAAAQDGGPLEHARHIQAKADMARARGRANGREWERAARAWDDVTHPYRATIARWRAAECLLAHGDRSGAGAAARHALRVARELGSIWLEREIRGLAERGRLALAGADAAAGVNGAGAADGTHGGDPGPASPEAAAPQDPFGLTARERQVLSLLAQGATNRQIGASLYMAEKTASVHVSRILAKLDVQGRTEAAAVAHRLHLA